MSSAKNAIIANRSCGNCNLCCKIPQIDDLKKPTGRWCGHCHVGKGCKIYGSHPTQCREFFCEYLTWNALGEHWRPSRCKMIVTIKGEGSTIAVLVDAGFPNAWREEPYYSEMRQWAVNAAVSRRQGSTQTHIFAVVGKRIIVIFPDSHTDLGLVADDERFLVDYKITPSGPRYEALKVKKDDPRLQGRPIMSAHA